LHSPRLPSTTPDGTRRVHAAARALPCAPMPTSTRARPPVQPNARVLPPTARATAASLRARGLEPEPLVRRGADLGIVVPLRRELPPVAFAKSIWDASEPVFLPGILRSRLKAHDEAIHASIAMFERLRQGAEFLDELETRMGDDAEFAYAGSSGDSDDARDIEAVFFRAEQGPFAGEQDLWARVSWIANDETDASLRIRHSSGDGAPDGWLRATDRTCRAVDALAQRAFPECAVIDGSEPLRAMLDAMICAPWRMSERILYNNAPGGGAVFHHDAEPGQLGVCFSQLEGRTAWLTLGKRRLARLLARRGLAKDERTAIQRLDRDDDRPLWSLLNRDAEFAQFLAAHGAVYVLEAGDSILLPSQAFDDCAWHSVVALGERPSLAHSYGLFPAQPAPVAKVRRSR
jgi:hypothetical protein